MGSLAQQWRFCGAMKRAHTRRRLFVFDFVWQRPPYARFLKGTLESPIIDVASMQTMVGDPLVLASFRCKHYRLSSETVDGKDIPWDADNVELYIVPGLRRKGRYAITAHMPEFFEDFQRGLPPATVSQPQPHRIPQRIRVTRNERDELRAEFPWLTDTDLGLATESSRCPRARRNAGATRAASGMYWSIQAMWIRCQMVRGLHL